MLSMRGMWVRGIGVYGHDGLREFGFQSGEVRILGY